MPGGTSPGPGQKEKSKGYLKPLRKLPIDGIIKVTNKGGSKDDQYSRT